MTSHAHHVTAGPSVWDTPWPYALVSLLILAPALIWLACAMTPGAALPRYIPPGWDRPPARVRRLGNPRQRFRHAANSPAFLPLYTGRHRTGWPAREVRQIGAATGEWAIVDVAEAGRKLEAIGGPR